jgi:hypothetical protein
MNKKIRPIFLNLIVLSLLISPLIVQAAGSSLVFCNQTYDATLNGGKGGFTVPCGWQQLIQLAQKLINYLILIAIPIAAVTFAYAGFLILSSGGNSGKVEKGKEIFMKVAIGMAWILAAWVVINTILGALLDSAKYPSLLSTPSRP